ncbi:MAG TPA: NTP transferase domain-containing protein [Candidatus Binataceae bacterium]|nr:NTP transferase domain-containing protein [Candidatus Binataceae bacterium]
MGDGGVSGAIIAAGRGERLRAAVGDIPKPLVELGGEAMLVRQARMLRHAGAASVVALVNSETARLLEARRLQLPDWLRLRVRDTASSMESLFALSDDLQAASHFVLATVDSVAAPGELRSFTNRAAELSAPRGGRFDGALAVVRWRGDRRPLFAAVGSDGAITALGEFQSAMVTAGFYWLPGTIFDLAPRARAAGLDAMRRLLGMAVESGMRLAAIELSGAIDVDESADLAAARALVGAAPGAERE